MSYILYYSNYCDKCKGLLRSISKSKIKEEIHFINIDKRFQDPHTKGIYVVLENNQKIVLPPQVTKVPALLLLKEGNNVIFGNEITNKIAPSQEFYEARATNFNGEPMAFSLGNDNIGGFGVASDSFSYWDQGSEELMAQGNGGLRQMYNYAAVNHHVSIETPPDTWSPDKVGEDALQKMESERNEDLRTQLNK